MSSPASVEALVADSEWLAHRYDPQHDAFHFSRVPRAMRAAVPFLTDAELPDRGQPIIIARRDVEAVPGPAAPLHFVFHSAYCCSTLLANVFDAPGVATTLKEPVLLNDLVGWRHRGGDPALIQRVMATGLRLLSRPFDPGTPVIVKPSNVVNALIPAMLALRPGAAALLLHAPLDTFVASIAGKGLWGRLWVRDLLAKQLRDGIVQLGLDADALFLLTDLQVAAVGWLVQHQLFARTANRFPERVRTIDSERLLDERPATIPALAERFGIAAAHVGTIATHPAFDRNSKDGRRFDADARRTRHAGAIEIHGDEIEKVTIWARALADNAGIDMTLPQPLLGAP